MRCVLISWTKWHDFESWNFTSISYLPTLQTWDQLTLRCFLKILNLPKSKQLNVKHLIIARNCSIAYSESYQLQRKDVNSANAIYHFKQTTMWSTGFYPIFRNPISRNVISRKGQLPETHFPEWTIFRKAIFRNGHFPECEVLWLFDNQVFFQVALTLF